MRMLETDRTVIDRITLEDAAFFVTLMNSPGWLRFIGDRSIADAADARRHLAERFLRSYEVHGFGYYVVRTAADRVPAGVCGFLKKPMLENPDFGFAFLPEHAGQGLAFESCRAVLEFGIATFRFDVLDAVTRADNVRSIRLLEKCGFHRLGPLAGDPADEPDLLFRWRAGKSHPAVTSRAPSRRD
jgi:RimJ/RimL family protein N-acetyltransferase